MAGVVSVRRNDVAELHRATLFVQHHDRGAIRLFNGREPTLDRDSQRPRCSFKSDMVVAPCLGKQVVVVGDDVRVGAPCDRDQPLRPDPSVVGHVRDVARDRPLELWYPLCATRTGDELVDSVWQVAHARDHVGQICSPGEAALTTRVAVQRRTPGVHSSSIPPVAPNLFTPSGRSVPARRTQAGCCQDRGRSPWSCGCRSIL